MKINIEIEVDEITGDSYRRLSSQGTEYLMKEVRCLLKKTVDEERKLRLRKLLSELKNTSGGKEFDVEILFHLINNDGEEISG